MDFMAAHDMTFQGVDQRPEQLAALADPVCQGGALQIYALTGVNLRLSIQRQMIDKLRDQHMGQQPRASEASGYRTTRRRHLRDVLAASANPLRTDMANDFETCRNILQHFGHILTQMTKLPTAASALRLGLMHMDFAWKVIGQRLSPRDGARWRFGWRRQLSLTDLQLFKTQLKLVDHRVQLFGAATKLHTT